VGAILQVNFPRPRERLAVLEHPDYYKLRAYLIEFLEFQAHKKNVPTPKPPAPPISEPAPAEAFANAT